MPFNGSGVYTPPAADFPFVAGTLIESAKVNDLINDMSTALSSVIVADGQRAASANLPMGGFRHTNVGNSSARSMYAATGQVQDNGFNWCGTAGGTADALTLGPTPAITAYAAGQQFVFKSGAGANTGAMTVAISSLTTKAIQTDGVAMTAGQVPASRWFRITYDGAAFQIEPVNLSATLAANNAWTGTNSFIDGNLSIIGSATATKVLKFEVDGQPAALTRTVTPGVQVTRAVVGADTFVETDFGKLVTLSGTFTMGTTAAATLGNGWWCDFLNIGTGTTTIDPNGAETIAVPGGPQTAGTTATFPYSGTGPGNYNMPGGRLLCDGSGFRVINVIEVHGEVIITATGAYTWTPPAGVTAIWIDASAGGGGGGGVNVGANSGTGGGGGESFIGLLANVTPGTNVTGTVGAGGAGGVSGVSNGANGANVTVVVPAGTLTLNGGGGGTNDNTTGGAGGTGGSAGAISGSNGGAGTPGGGTLSSNSGGSSMWGKGGATGAATAVAGNGFGAGGAGRASVAGNGAAGTQGFVRIRW